MALVGELKLFFFSEMQCTYKNSLHLYEAGGRTCLPLCKTHSVYCCYNKSYCYHSNVDYFPITACTVKCFYSSLYHSNLPIVTTFCRLKTTCRPANPKNERYITHLISLAESVRCFHMTNILPADQTPKPCHPY